MAPCSANRRLVVGGRIEECVSTEHGLCLFINNSNLNTMAKKAKKVKTSKGVELRIVNPDAAGIDIADGIMQVCVPADRAEESNRAFGAYTSDLHAISQWLKKCGIKTVAMESTGVYWIPLFCRLQEDGLDVVLTNARDVKNITERKTDESDAEWLMLLHQYGLLKASFQPHNDAKRIRTLTRHRDTLSREASSVVLRMQKAMQQMNLKLTLVLSDITGKSGICIIEAILAGELDAQKLAALADIQCKTPKEEIAKALEGNWEADLMFVLRQNYDTFRHYCSQLEQCDAELEILMEAYRANVSRPEQPSYVSAKKRRDYHKRKRTVGFDVERKAYDMWGVNVFEIPGISHLTALELMSELGHDFIQKFPSSKQFCCWCNIAPNTKISGGKKISSHVPHRRNKVGLIFRNIASSLANAKNQLGNFYRRIRSRAGGKAAVIATAHKVAEIFFAMIANQTPYDPTKVGIDEQALLEKRIARYKHELERITGMKMEITNTCVP